MNEYNSMAFNYEDQGDYVTACYFYNKVIDIAASCKVNLLLNLEQAILVGGNAWVGQVLRSTK